MRSARGDLRRGGIGRALRRVRGSALLVLGLFGAFHSQAALAAERGPELNWVRLPGAESCVAPVELTERVEQRLGRAVFVRARDAIVVIEGRVEPSLPIGFSVVLQVSDPDGTLYGAREITLADADCRKLDEIVALVIAVTIRQGSGGSGIAIPYSVVRALDRLFEDDSSELDPNSLPPGDRAPLRSASSTTPPKAAASSTQRSQDASGRDGSSSEAGGAPVGDGVSGVGWDLTAGLSFASGLQPEFTLAPTIAGRLALAAIGSIAISASAGLTKDQTLGGGERGVLEYSVLAAGIALCAPSWWLGASEIAACAAGAIGNVHVSARDFQVQTGATDELWVEVGPRLFGRAQVVGPAFLQLTLGAPIRLRAPAFEYKSSLGRTQPAFEMARVGVQAEVALGVRL
jgi:hypothetical protein